MAVKSSFRGGWSMRFHLLLRLAGLTGLLAAVVGLAIVVADANWSTVDSVRASLTSRFKALVEGPGDDAALAVTRYLIPIGLALALLAVIVEIWMAIKVVAGRRSAFGMNVVFQLALALLLLVGVNVYATLHYARLDWTRDRQFTLDQDLQKQLHELKTDTPTTIVVYQRHKTFGTLSDKPDDYDYAAERKVVEKVHDLVDQFREFGPQFRVEVLDIEVDYKNRLDQITKQLAEDALAVSSGKKGDVDEKQATDEEKAAKAKEFRAQIESAPENSIFFFGGGKVQRLSFNDFYQLDKTDSQAKENLVLLYQGVGPFTGRLLNIDEKRPKVGILVVHEWLTTEGPEEFGLAGLKKALTARGFDVVDVVLKKWGEFGPPEPAVYTYGESELERVTEEIQDLEAGLKRIEEEIPVLKRLIKEWQTASLEDLSKSSLAKQLRIKRVTEADRQQVIREILEDNVEERHRAQENGDKELAGLKKKREGLAKFEEGLKELKRVTDLKAKLDRTIADCDLLIIPRMTIKSLTTGYAISNRIYRLEDTQVAAIKDYVKAGKPILACLGPSNEPAERPDPFNPAGGPDGLENLFADLGIKLGKQTVLFDAEAKSFAEKRSGLLSAGANVEVPSVEFSGKPGASRLRFQEAAEEPKPNRIRDSMKIIARAVGQAPQRTERAPDSSEASSTDQEKTASNVLKLSLRHPRPVYFEPADGKSLDYDPVFMISSPASWNDNQPFPTRERTPHYERPKEDDPTKGTFDEPRRGPFPLGVAVQTTVPAAWYSDKPDKPANVRLVVIGHGGWFVGNDLSPAKEQLLLNTCNWLLGRDDRLTTDKGPPWKYPRVAMSPRVQFLWLSGACIGLPLLFLYLGLMVLLVRRLR